MNSPFLFIVLFIVLFVVLFFILYKSTLHEGYSSIIPMNCDDPNNNTNLLRYDCR